jgi:hypothetical protein
VFFAATFGCEGILQMEQNSDDEKQRAPEPILDPVSRAIANAPIDDEPVTPEEEAAVEESREWLKHNKGIPHEQILAEFGITPEEIERFTESIGESSSSRD